MDALRQQIVVLNEELNTVKMELVNVKQNHANLHQQASDANAAHARTNADTKAQISSLEDRIGNKGNTDRATDRTKTN